VPKRVEETVDKQTFQLVCSGDKCNFALTSVMPKKVCVCVCVGVCSVYVCLCVCVRARVSVGVCECNCHTQEGAYVCVFVSLCECVR